MQSSPLPNFLSRRRDLIMQARVSIVPKSNAVLRTRCARKECRGSPSVQIVNNIILLGPKFASDTPARSCPIARRNNNSINQVRTFEHWRDPIFQENIDLSARQKPAQCEQ